ncbi:uncharacterized protein G2W53_008530 [Senna tora]|uniref:Uncharacterized protein n=1 Tax=Senna tora TaxID=362788 RepID=A0A834X923_9FABA|nr:uncharacterized protein G2W53_008530 [Senna tora]
MAEDNESTLIVGEMTRGATLHLLLSEYLPYTHYPQYDAVAFGSLLPIYFHSHVKNK